ncbi:hypothetical protein OH797_25415 [Streptomyces anulatus]|uniref:hypothetical protein n=1 Tax=Streptomyces TaxID=1883 RepID=UPI0006F6DC5C|nr:MULTISPECIES: hypothetical protein [Streptomyces]KQX28757.1 hypothetical protein ASD29_26920 [Streptomyces sp. Root1295]KRA49802.1 hypothetical protein ASD97_04985 [Streptomyces sp. Root63]MDF9803919.1 hypothetical protein [Streptomyces sp. HB372]GGY66760.1 hypothetical protein GCM10010342_63080 [Streptomyces anulatus]
MNEQPQNAARLLPWAGVEGRPCYVAGDGQVSRTADRVEAMQLGMAYELLDHADDMVEDDRSTAVQLRHVAAALTHSLRDVHRVARSRGLRLGIPDAFEPGHPSGPGLVRLRP